MDVYIHVCTHIYNHVYIFIYIHIHTRMFVLWLPEATAICTTSSWVWVWGAWLGNSGSRVIFKGSRVVVMGEMALNPKKQVVGRPLVAT